MEDLVEGLPGLLRAANCFKGHSPDRAYSEVVSGPGPAHSDVIVHFVVRVDHFHFHVENGSRVAFHIREVGPCFLRVFSLNPEAIRRIKVHDQAHLVPALPLHLFRVASRLKAVNTLAGCKAR